MVKKGALFLLVVLLYVFGVAQPKEDEINIKQKFLKRQTDDIKEEIDSFRTLHLIIAGNVYQTEKHLAYAYNNAEGKYDFKSELKYIQPILNLGDVTIANMKTSFGNNVNNLFSSPDEFALAVKYSGINAVMHANMFTANTDRESLKRTRDLLNDFDMFHTGAFIDPIERAGNYPLIINKKGFKIAILNYADMNNRPSISRNFFINEIDKSYIDRDMRMAQANKPDFIIVYFDWGMNAQTEPTPMQQEITKYVFQKGANLVVGSGPNAPLGMDFLNYFSQGKNRDGLVAYSLGNLISSDEQIKNRNGYIIDMEIKKNNFTHETKVEDWGVIPVYTYYDTITNPGKTKVYSLPCWAVESGDIFQSLPYIEKRRVVNSAYEVRKLLGAMADEVQYNLVERIVNNVEETIEITGASINNKFSQKRGVDIKPSAAPLSASLTPGNSEPASLAKVMSDYEASKNAVVPKGATAKNYKTQPKTEAAKTETALDKEKRSAESIFDAPAQPTGIGASVAAVQSPATAPANNIQPPAAKPTTSNGDEGVTTANNSATNLGTALQASSKQENNTAPVVAKAEIKNTTPKTSESNSNTDKNTSTSTPKIESGKPTSTNSAVASNSASKTNTSPVDEPTAKGSATAKPSGAEDLKSKNTASVTSNDAPKTAAKPATPAGDGKTGQAANTNYHTTGNNYELKDKEYVDRSHQPASIEEKQKAKQQTVEAKPIDQSDISTKINNTERPNLNRIKGKEFAVQIDTVYKIQFYAMKKYLPLDTNYYTHLKGYEVYEEGGLFKYVLGNYASYKECYNYWKNQIQPRYKESFIVKFIKGKRVLK